MKKILSIAFMCALIMFSFCITSLYLFPKSEQQVNAISFNAVKANSTLQSVDSSGAHDTVKTPLFSKTNIKGSNIEKQIFVSIETGILLSENYEPISDTNDTNTLVTIFDEENKSFINSKEQTLSIYLDSRLDRNYLVNGGRALTHINLDREIFLINFKPNGGLARLIYCFREERKLGFLENIITVGKKYNYFDMNGMQIEDKHITNLKSASFWQMNLAIITAGQLGGFVAQHIDIVDKTTLGELRAYIYDAIHPWQKLDALTMDGFEIYINPRTKQLTDFYGAAIFNMSNGLPLTMFSDDIFTTDGKKQIINNGIMLDVYTTNTILNSGANFYIGTTITIFGVFDVPMINQSGDIYNPEWVLFNGDSADDIILEGTYIADSKDGETFGQWFGGIFKGIGNFFGNTIGALFSGFFSGMSAWLITIFIFIAVLILLPVLIPLIQSLGHSFKKLIKPIKKAKKAKTKNQRGNY